MILVRDEVGLNLGIAFDGVGIFDNFLMAADIIETQDFIEAFHDFAHLAQLVLVVRSKYNLSHLEFGIQNSKIQRFKIHNLRLRFPENLL